MGMLDLFISKGVSPYTLTCVGHQSVGYQCRSVPSGYVCCANRLQWDDSWIFMALQVV